MRKPVVGFEGLYEVDDEGRVFSLRDGREMRPYRNHRGYLLIKLRVGDERRGLQVHRMVLEAHVGPCPEGMEARHIDGDRTNNRVSNLAWATHAENCADKVAHGTHNRGERNNMAKLTDDIVREMRSMYASGFSLARIARRFGISKSGTHGAVSGRSWGWL